MKTCGWSNEDSELRLCGSEAWHSQHASKREVACLANTDLEGAKWYQLTTSLMCCRGCIDCCRVCCTSSWMSWVALRKYRIGCRQGAQRPGDAGWTCAPCGARLRWKDDPNQVCHLSLVSVYIHLHVNLLSISFGQMRIIVEIRKQYCEAELKAKRAPLLQNSYFSGGGLGSSVCSLLLVSEYFDPRMCTQH